VATAALAFGLLPSTAGAQGVNERRRVVVIIADDLTATQLSLAGSVQQEVADGAAGLIVSAPAPGAGGQAPLASSATLSAGRRSVGPVVEDSPDAVMPGEPNEETPQGTIGDLYRARTGQPPGPVALVYPDIGLMARLNATATVGASPGLLGELLRQQGVITAAVGTSDLPDEPYRPAPIVAMDALGRVPFGTTHTDVLQPDQVVPEATDVEALQDATANALSRARLVVVDWGDTSRIDRLFEQNQDQLDERDASGRTLEARLTAARAESVQALGRFVTFIRGKIARLRDVLVIVSPNAPFDDRSRGLYLSPITVSGGGITHGSLTSATTDRGGYVSNQDLGPSILRWFGIAEPGQMVGSPMSVSTELFPLRVAEDEERAAGHRLDQIPWVLGVALLIAALGLGLGIRAIDERLRILGDSLAEARGTGRRAGASRLRRIPPVQDPVTPVRILLLSVAWVPLALLVMPLLWDTSTLLAALQVAVASLALGLVWALAAKERTVTSLGTIATLTLLVLFVDGLLGSPLANESVAGPRPWNGEVYGGLGPFFAGAVVACALVAVGAIARAVRRAPGAARWVVLGVGAGFVVVLSLPGMGGTPAVGVAGIAGLATIALLLRRTQLTRRRWELVAGGVAAVLVVLGVVLLAVAVSQAVPAPSTLGEAPGAASAFASLLLADVADWAAQVFLSGWTLGLAVAGLALGYVWWRSRKGPWIDAPRGRGLPPADRFVTVTVVALLVAAAVALVTSGTGAVTATSILMGAALVAVAGGLDRVRGIRPRS
jgi:hypothetical protein